MSNETSSQPTTKLKQASNTPENATALKFEFKSAKNCYLTREEIDRMTYGSNKFIIPAERENDQSKFGGIAVSAINASKIYEFYRPEYSTNDPKHSNDKFDENHSTIMKQGLMDPRTYHIYFQESFNCINPQYNQYKSFLSRKTYIAPFITKWEKQEPLGTNTHFRIGGRTTPEVHFAYYAKVDQPILDRLSFYSIESQILKNNFPSQSEEFEFSFPMLAKTNGNLNKDKKSKERKYDFIKVIVSSITNPNISMSYLEKHFIIRIFRITNSKTHCTKRYFVGNVFSAKAEAAEMYRKVGNDSYYELYDLENINEFIDLHICPDNKDIRFIPDGYYGDHAYIHDRESDKYVKVNEWKTLEKKKLKKIEEAKRVVISNSRKSKKSISPDLIDLIKEKQKQHEDVLDFLNSL